MRMFRLIAFFLMTSASLGVTILYGEEMSEIERRLQTAEQDAQAAIDKAWTDLCKSLEAKRDIAQRKGDLTEYELLSAELKACESRLKLPTSVDTRALAGISKKASSDLERAYRLAVLEYTKAGDINAAKALKKRMDDLKTKAIGRPLDAVRFQGRYYKLFADKLTWDEAQKRCEQLGGHLATVRDKDEHAFLMSLMDKSNVNQAWLGATDQKNENAWEWINGEKFSYADWGPGEPNNYRGSENYLVLIKSLDGNAKWRGKWSDQPADSVNHPGFICEWE